jgi:hypothetical protein
MTTSIPFHGTETGSSDGNDKATEFLDIVLRMEFPSAEALRCSGYMTGISANGFVSGALGCVGANRPRNGLPGCQEFLDQ